MRPRVALLQRKWCVLYRSAMKIQLSIYDASSCNCYYFMYVTHVLMCVAFLIW